jgi:hypothetical protein
MEVSLESQDCWFRDETFSVGTEICELMRCMICRNGKWEDWEIYGLAASLWQPFFRGLRPI